MKVYKPLCWGMLFVLAVAIWSCGPAATPAATQLPAAPQAPLATQPPAPPVVSLMWNQVSTAQEFRRDTITAIVIHPRNENVIVIATENSGVYRSSDSGFSWQPKQSGLESMKIYSLLMDPQNPQIIYATTETHHIYRTMNEGENWELFLNEGSTLLMDPHNGSHLYYTEAFEGGSYESNDGGVNWSSLLDKKDENGNPRCPNLMTSLSPHPIDPSILFAVDRGGNCQAGIYESTDGGASWGFVSSMPGDLFTLSVGIDKKGNTVFYGLNEQGWLNGISHDKGQTWKPADNRLDRFPFLIDPKDPGIAYSGTYRTKDGGANWTRAIQTADPVTALAISTSDGSNLYLGMAGTGFFLSTDGGATLKKRSDGLGVFRIDLQMNIDDRAALYNQEGNCFNSELLRPFLSGSWNFNPCELYLSLDGGQNWSRLTDSRKGRAPIGLAFDADGRTIYSTVEEDSNSSLLVSEDRGQSWIDLGITLSQATNFLAAHPAKNATLYRLDPKTDSLYLSTDAGGEWKQLPRPDINAGPSTEKESARLFVTPQDILYFASDVLYRSDDGGRTWISCDEARKYPLWPLTIDAQDAHHLLLGVAGQGVLVSRDGCKSWQTAVTGLSNLYVNSIVFDPANSNTIYVGTDNGAYVSFDGSKTWNQSNDGLVNSTIVYSIVSDSQSNVYAATPDGIFMLERR